MIRTRSAAAIAALPALLALLPSPAGAEELSFVARLNGQNEIPPLDIPSAAVAHMVLDTDTGRFRFEVQFFDIVHLLQVHIHRGGPSVNGPLIYSLSRTGETVASGEQSFRPEDLPDLLSGNLYVNAHTVANQDGEIRGQLLPGSIRGRTAAFEQPLGPDGVVPPVVDLEAGGIALVALDLRLQGSELVAGSAVYDLDYRFAGAVTLRGLHVHRGPAGVTGPIVLDSGLTPRTDSDGRGRLVFRVPVSSASALDVLQEIQDLPSEFYIDLHTSDHPEGAIRGQLNRVPAALPPRTRLP
jgi:hypothetical protein